MAALASRLCAATFAGAFLLLPAGAASAQDMDAALESLKTHLAAQGMTVDWTHAEIDGTDARLTGVTGSSDGETIEIGDMEVTGVEEAEGGFRFGRISMPEYESRLDAGTVSLEDVTLDRLFVPDEGDEQAASPFFYESAAIGRVLLTIDDAQAMEMADLRIEVTPAEDDAPLTFQGQAGQFTANVEAFADPRSRDVMAALGYSQLEGDLGFAGSWAEDEGRMRLSQYDFRIEEAGTLSVSLDVSGFTPELMQSASDLQENMTAGSSNASGQQMAMFGLLQQLSLHELDIAFHDDSLTGKALDYVAAQQGTSAANLASQTKMMLPMVLAQMQAPQLSAMISQAVSTYLDDPQTLRIRAAPAVPVPFAMLMAVGATSPDALVEQVGVSVTANE